MFIGYCSSPLSACHVFYSTNHNNIYIYISMWQMEKDNFDNFKSKITFTRNISVVK